MCAQHGRTFVGTSPAVNWPKRSGVNPVPAQLVPSGLDYAEPATGDRPARVIERRTRVDFAQAMERFVQTYPRAELLRVVRDNLNTYSRRDLQDNVFTQNK